MISIKNMMISRHGAKHSENLLNLAHFGVHFAGPPVDFLDVRMILGRRQHPGNDPALLGHFHAFIYAQALDSIFRHGCSQIPRIIGKILYRIAVSPFKARTRITWFRHADCARPGRRQGPDGRTP
mgnify:CR=1 FL=1